MITRADIQSARSDVLDGEPMRLLAQALEGLEVWLYDHGKREPEVAALARHLHAELYTVKAEAVAKAAPLIERLAEREAQTRAESEAEIEDGASLLTMASLMSRIGGAA